jgi:hypothetical protein
MVDKESFTFQQEIFYSRYKNQPQNILRELERIKKLKENIENQLIQLQVEHNCYCDFEDVLLVIQAEENYKSCRRRIKE